MNEENVINQVQNYPYIYESSKCYDQNLKERAWAELTILMSNDEACNYQNKWPYLRQKYMRSLKLGEKQRNTTAMESQIDTTVETFEDVRTSISTHHSVSESNSYYQDNNNSCTATSTLPKSSRKRSSDTNVAEILERYLLKQDELKNNPNPVDMFFNSIAQTVKTFPRDLQVTIKRKVFELVNNAEASLLDTSDFSRPNNEYLRVLDMPTASLANECDTDEDKIYFYPNETLIVKEEVE